jgi:hypothetical protein
VLTSLKALGCLKSLGSRVLIGFLEKKQQKSIELILFN